MKRWIATALVSSAVIAHAQSPAPATPPAPAAAASAPMLPSSPAKKELVRRLLQAQQPVIEGISRNMVERAPAQMMQEAGRYLQTQVPAEKREAASDTIKAELKKYIDESVPLVRASAMKVAPATLGADFEQKFTEDELKVIVAWMESPVNKKYQQVAGDIQTDFMQKLAADVGPSIEPKLRALEEKTRVALGAPAPGAAPAPTASASAPQGKSSAKSATKPASK